MTTETSFTPTRAQLGWTAALAVVAVLLALPAAAHATLTFVRNPFSPAVYVAKDDGSAVRKVGSGYSPRVSPDGQTVAYLRTGSGNAQELVVTPAAGGPKRVLLRNWREPFLLAFSPDSATIAALRGPELGKRKLVLIGLAGGTQRVLAQGYFSGFSFDPGGSGELVFAKAGRERYPLRSDVYRVAPGSKPVRLTGNHLSQSPLWGPKGKIVFVKLLGLKQRRYGPKNELFLMNRNGRGVKRLTRTKVGPLLQGLVPTQWSDSGNQLLAEFVGQDTSYAVAVNPKTGGQRPVHRAGEIGFVGSAISGDGKAVLGFTGGFEPGPRHNVATVPYKGGKARVLVKRAYEPDWSR